MHRPLFRLLPHRATHQALLTIAVGTGLGVAMLAGLPAWAQNTVGDVVRVDKAQGKLTLKHGAIASLDMPAMTMAYRVRDPQWLDQLKPGDRVRFDADRINGQFTVTRLSIGP
ncbi:MAG: copper-binding protein [Leptothrix sp. (in: b-proteobacteria)]